MIARPQSSGLPNVGQDVANLGLVRPPLVYLTSLVTGALIHLATPFPLLPGSLAAPLGAVLVVVAIALFSYSVAKFRAAGTPVPARKPTTVIVQTGPYRFSRNPIYRAFVDADAMAKWLPPNGFTGKVHHMDAKVGGTYKMSFTNFTTGRSHSFGGKYLELVPHERIRHTDKFDDPNLPGEMQTTITLKKVSCGTELNIAQEGLPDVIPPEACCLGWQESLTLLAQLVEAEIPD